MGCHAFSRVVKFIFGVFSTQEFKFQLKEKSNIWHCFTCLALSWLLLDCICPLLVIKRYLHIQWLVCQVQNFSWKCASSVLIIAKHSPFFTFLLNNYWPCFPWCRWFSKKLLESSTLVFRGNHCLLNLPFFCVRLIDEGLLFLLEIWLKCLKVAPVSVMGTKNDALNLCVLNLLF